MLAKLLLSILFCSAIWNPSRLQAQPRLASEIKLIVEELTKQINRDTNIKTIAIADFTDLSYTPNLLGKQLAEEFLSSFVQSSNKKFAVISRNRLESLIDEANLAESGFISPKDIPKIGILKGIDLIVEATLSPNANHVRINAKGLEIESGNVMAAYTGIVTLTPSLKKLVGASPAKSKDLVTGKTKTNLSPISHTQSFTKGSIEVEARGCQNVGNELVCHFSVLSKDIDEVLSLYCFSSKVFFSSDRNQVLRPSKLQFGEQSGNRRITKTLRANETEDILVFLNSELLEDNFIPKISIKCHTNSQGSFDIQFDNLPIPQ